METAIPWVGLAAMPLEICRTAKVQTTANSLNLLPPNSVCFYRRVFQKTSQDSSTLKQTASKIGHVMAAAFYPLRTQSDGPTIHMEF